jgi:hypothetical protein
VCEEINFTDSGENPHSPKIVSRIEHITIHFVCSLLISFGLMSANMIVINDILIETYPAYDDGTPKYTCMVGHPEPSSESGSPRLMKIRYIPAISNEACARTSIPLQSYLSLRSEIFSDHMYRNRQQILCNQSIEVFYSYCPAIPS